MLSAPARPKMLLARHEGRRGEGHFELFANAGFTRTRRFLYLQTMHLGISNNIDRESPVFRRNPTKLKAFKLLRLLPIAVFTLLVLLAPPVSAQPLLDNEEALTTTSEVKTSGETNGDATPAQKPAIDAEDDTDTSEPPSSTTPMLVPVAEAKQKLAEWRIDLDQGNAVLRREGLTRKDLDRLQKEAENLRIEARELRRAIEPSVEALEARIKQLEPTKKDEVESEDLKKEREAQAAELANLQGIVKQISVIALRTDELAVAIDERHRAIFAERLFENHRSIVDPTLWITAVGNLPEVANSLRLLVSDWWGLINNKIGKVAGLLLVLLAALVAVSGAVAQRLLLRRTKRDREAVDPPLLKKVWSALTILVVNLLIPLICVAIFFGILELLGVSPRRIDLFARTVFFSTLALAAAHGLSRALLAPDRPAWRMVPLTDEASERVMVLTFMIAGVLAMNIFFDGMARNLLSPLSITVVLHAVLSIVFHVLILLSLRTIAIGRTELASGAKPEGQLPNRSAFWRWLLPLAFLASLAGLVATVIGYISFGWFVATQIVWVTFILGLLHLLLILADEVFTTGLRQSGLIVGLSGASAGSALSRTGEQFGVVLSGIVRLLLIAFAAILVLSPWGVRSSKLYNSLEAAFFGIRVGDVTFSLSAILIALAIFIAGTVATRSIQRWMEQSLLPHTRLDVGLKSSIKTAIGYVGVFVAGMFAFSYVGLDLSNIAIVAGALSVGIGFGLQSIVNNFVSGLILLAERPIKVDDWIVVGDEQGYVRKINVRATEIETFDRASVIVPNSDLISGVVKNWMHNDSTGRIIVPVGVAYDSNPDQVREILLECAREQHMVLAYPAPSVYFMEFGASSLDFQLRCYLSNIDYALSVSSDIRFAVFRRLSEAGIEIPFPQSDINFRDVEKLEGFFNKKPAPRAQKKPETDG